MMFSYFKYIWRGQSLARILMNHSLTSYAIRGKVVDIGGSRHPDYFSYMRQEPGTDVINLDLQQPENTQNHIDFEKDLLPYQTTSVDTVLMFNILEHIYNHNFLVGEAYRVMKQNSELIGFVPFLVNYHPDPHDYFRYTKETLQKILEKAGFRDIHIYEVGRGPFAVNYNTIMLSMPRIFRILLLPFYYVLDSVMLRLRPRVRIRYPLGYRFDAKK